MITIQSAQVYSSNGEMAFQVTYSDGIEVRAVESVGSIIRSEYRKNGVWAQCGKPYKIQASRGRNAERIKDAAKRFVA